MIQKHSSGRIPKSLNATGIVFDPHPSRESRLGNLPISRALPIRERRLVGPWCFLDCFGPLTFAGDKPMDVPPHPHIGLQTVTWLLAGEVLHSDSLGYEAVVRPGGVNVMTSGAGISHAEETPPINSGHLSGVQLWTALPDSHRHVQPSFMHLEQVPLIEVRGGIIQVFTGALGGRKSPAPFYSEILGADLQIHAGEILELELNPEFEHAALVLSADCMFESQPLDERTLYYLGTRRECAAFSSQQGGRVLLIGGLPFPEQIIMWWNFVARAQEEIAQARADWEANRLEIGERFGKVVGEHGGMLAAPELVRFARPNPVS